MLLTEKDIFIQIRASRREKNILKAMARKSGYDMTGIIMKWYRAELKKARAKAESLDISIDAYLKLEDGQVAKDSGFTMRITPEQRARLNEIAEQGGGTMTNVVNRVIDVAWKAHQKKVS